VGSPARLFGKRRDPATAWRRVSSWPRRRATRVDPGLQRHPRRGAHTHALNLAQPCYHTLSPSLPHPILPTLLQATFRPISRSPAHPRRPQNHWVAPAEGLDLDALTALFDQWGWNVTIFDGVADEESVFDN
jgi:hypothetical protein